MKRTWVALFTAFCFVGCGGEKKDANDDANAMKSATDNAPKLQVIDHVEPLTDETTAFSKQLDKLSSLANKQQMDFQFADAATTWAQVERLLVGQFGSESWQTVNARIAGETASIEAGFDDEKIQKLRKVFQKQQEIGSSLRESDLQTAMKLSAESSQLTEELFGAESFMMGKQLMQLARMYQQIGRFELASSEFKHAAMILQKFLGDQHPDLEICYAYLGEVFAAQGNVEQAIAHHSKATEISGKVWGEDSLRFAARANELGVAFHRNRQYDTAIKVLRTAEAIRRGRLSETHPQVAHSLTNLGVVYLDSDEKALAEKCLQESHDIFRKHYGDNHGLTADCKSKLATVKMLVQKPDEAEVLLTQLINLVQDNSNPVAVATLQYRLAIALSRQGKYSRAEPLFKSALELQKENFGSTHQATVSTMKAYALLLKQSKREGEAEQMYSEINRIAQQPSSATFR